VQVKRSRRRARQVAVFAATSLASVATGASSAAVSAAANRQPSGRLTADAFRGGELEEVEAQPTERRRPTGAQRPAQLSPPLQPSVPTLPYLTLAEQGVARAQRTWRARGGWYYERLNDHEAFPLATIWGIVPLFEALDAVQIAVPSASHRQAVARFASGAERYFNASLHPMPGFAPYPNDRGQVRTWFDDNAWWGLAFMDAYRATGNSRYVHDAERAFSFIAKQGWDAAGGGGLWWNTSHPYKAGEPLAAGSLLGALLYQRTGRKFFAQQVDKFLTWADSRFLTEDRLYKRTDSDATPTPYIEGPLVEAHQLLCQAGQQEACARAKELAASCWQRFEERLNMGPQYDTIYLHWMLVYGAQTGDRGWLALARRKAAEAQAHALNVQNGLYLRAWDGSSITAHEARPNMLQTDAATVELMAWLATTN
jgi:Glycosyl hydrolase family 76